MISKKTNISKPTCTARQTDKKLSFIVTQGRFPLGSYVPVWISRGFVLLLDLLKSPGAGRLFSRPVWPETTQSQAESEDHQTEAILGEFHHAKRINLSL